MTPISALSFVPVPGPQPSGQAGIIGASQAFATEALPGALPAVNGEASAANWLMAWLGEQNSEVEVTEAIPEEAPPPSSIPSKVHWLSLLPAVASFEEPVSTVTSRSGQEPVSPEGAVQASESEVPGLPLVVTENDEKEEHVSAVDAEPVPAVQSAPAPAGLVETPIVVPVATPVDTDLPASPSAGTEKAVRSESPIANASPDQSAAERSPAVSAMGQRPAPRTEDKGEVIWSVKFAVKEEQAVEAEVGDSVPAIRPQGEASVRPLPSAESDAPAKPAVAGVRARQPEESPRQPLDPEHSESEGEEPEKKQTMDFPRERLSGRNAQESKQESTSPGSEHSEPKLTESGLRTSTFAAEFVSRAATPGRVNEAAPAEGVALEPAVPLKPAQIATLQVDVPAPVGSDDVTPMRLVVTQRGDQVNVRLRSFDSAVAPIDDSRMQPLLHSLAEKGFVAELKPGARLDEAMPVTVERTQEKQMVRAESPGSQNDAQAFQNANERQQQNQERQQQQQAFFLRKQLKNVQSEAFTLPVAAEVSNGTFQQGASR